MDKMMQWIFSCLWKVLHWHQSRSASRSAHWRSTVWDSDSDHSLFGQLQINNLEFFVVVCRWFWNAWCGRQNIWTELEPSSRTTNLEHWHCDHPFCSARRRKIFRFIIEPPGFFVAAMWSKTPPNHEFTFSNERSFRNFGRWLLSRNIQTHF